MTDTVPPTGQLPTQPPNLEFILAQQANDAMSKGADPHATTERLGQMIRHIRANPDIAKSGSDALAKGADPGAVTGRVWKLVQGVVSSSAPVAAPQAPRDGAEEGVLDRFLNMATVGLHPKILGVGNAIEDILTHGTGSHPIQSYEQGVEGTKQRMGAASTVHPTSSTAADATGFFSTLAADAPIRATLAARAAAAQGLRMLPKAVGYAEGAPGIGAALKRIGQSAKTGAATGAVVGGLSSDGSPTQRATAIGTGGILGGAFGGAAQSLGEAGGGLKGIIQQIMAPVAELGETGANRRILGKLSQGGLDPTDLLSAAQRAQAVGSPERVAHLGGPSFDNLTWLASTGQSPEAAQLKAGVTAAQRGEVDLLHRGVTEMSGVPHTPSNQADTFLQRLEDVRQTAGRRDYPAAYAQPNITDPNILKAVRRDPDLRAALNQGVGVMRREAELERIQSGSAQPKVVNPLSVKPPAQGPVLNDIGEALVQAGVPEERVIAQGYIREPEPADQPTLPIQMLDYMKQGIGPVIERGLKKGQLSAHDAGIMNEKVQTLLEQIDNPVYDAARRNQAALFGQIEAGQAGAKAFTQAPEVIATQRADLSPGQETAYRTTQTSTLRDRLNDKKHGADLSTGLFDTPTMQAQLRASYPEANRLDPYLEHGRTLNRVNQAVTGNSKTAERQGAQGEVLDNTAMDAAHFLASPHRAIYNIPGRIADARNKEVKQVMLQSLAKKLQVPANSPDLYRLVEQLIQTSKQPSYTEIRSPLLKWVDLLSHPNAGATRRATATGGGILSGLLSGGATQ